MTAASRRPAIRRGAVAAGVAAMIGGAAILHWLPPLRPADGFLVPSPADAARARTGFAAALAGDLASAQGRLEGLGTAPPPQPGLLALGEAVGDCRGRGAYLMRPSPAVPLAIMAPHRGADRLTGTLAAQLFARGRAAAAAWNSAPRRGGADCPGGDPTRHATHHLTAFALAFAARYPDGRIVQIHGFDPARRQSRAAQLADVIVSAGTAAPPGGLFDLADCLAAALPAYHVSVYPADVRELGATGNAQGQALRAEGFAGFVHLELSPALRRALTGDAALRSRFAACIEAPSA